jgi:hypothetical protein
MRFVQLVGVPGTGNGSVDFLPQDKGVPVIKVGLAVPWEEAIGVLLHEAFEASFIDLNTRFQTNPAYSGESSDYVFVMSHNQFSEAAERVGDFVKHALPAFSVVYRAHEKKRLTLQREKKALEQRLLKNKKQIG